MTHLTSLLRTSADQAANVFAKTLSGRGDYLGVPKDLAAYYKHPMMWIAFGDWDKANAVLDHIKTCYLQDNGDFLLEGTGTKSQNLIYQEFYTYTNGWVVRAAQKCKRIDIATPGLGYLTACHNPKTGGFYTHDLALKEGITDVITTAHLGLVCLEAD